MATALLEKQDTQGGKGDTESTQDHWTVEAYYEAFHAGAFQDPKRLELIHGKIIRKMPQDPSHTFLRRRLATRLRSVVGPALLVMEENPLRLALDGEPVPDVLVVTGAEKDYERRHPTQADAVLVVEVSNTTADYDLSEKALLYAQAGITDYWVVLVKEKVLAVHHEPSPEGYKEVIRLSGEDTLSLPTMPEAAWTVNALLGEEG